MKIVYLVLLAAGLSFTGCYTVLEHPDVSSKDENGFVYNDEVAFTDDCNSCHTSTDQAIMSPHPQMYSTYRNQRADDRSYHDGYYSQSSFGDYGYYYETPWWFEVSRSGSGDATAKQNDNTRARNNSGRDETTEREAVRSRNDGGGLNYTSPTRSSNSGSGSSNNSGVSKSSNSGDSSSSSRSNNDAPKSRDNDGSRSSKSGRR